MSSHVDFRDDSVPCIPKTDFAVAVLSSVVVEFRDFGVVVHVLVRR
jgi:hypothetical protein